MLVNFVENLVYFKKCLTDTARWILISLLFEFVATSPNKLVSIYNNSKLQSSY